MSQRKFFTLMNGSEVRIAPGARVIPAKEFSILVDAKEVLGKIQEDAQQYRKDTSVACEAEKEQAQREGFALGLQQWAQQLTLLEQEQSRVHDKMMGLIVPLAIKAARKIVGREIELDDSTVADIVASTLKSVSEHRQIMIYVNPREYDLLDQNKNKLKAVFERLDSLGIQARDDVPMGGCVIETEAGIINASIENQWSQLEQAMLSILDKQEES